MICNTLHARYIGPYAELKGETALIRSPVDFGWTIPVHVLAQFDDLSLGMNANHGWVTVPMSHFEVLPAYRVGTPEHEDFVAFVEGKELQAIRDQEQRQWRRQFDARYESVMHHLTQAK